MIRFILRSRRTVGGYELAGLFTLDVDVPELERQIGRGGYDLAEGRFEVVELVDAEIIRDDEREVQT